MAGVMIFSLAACNDADDSGKELKLDKTTVSVEEGRFAVKLNFYGFRCGAARFGYGNRAGCQTAK